MKSSYPLSSGVAGFQTRKSIRAYKERLIRAVLYLCGTLSILITVGIIGVLSFETIAFFKTVPIVDFFSDFEWTPLFAEKHFGIWPLWSGTMLTSLIAIIVALPFGILSAIYLSEFAPEKVRKILKPALELLAGIPTIVYGFFALVVVTPWLQKWIPGLAGFNALSPGIVMGIMIIPLISSLSEDALYAVPSSLREGAYALGSGKVSAIFRVVIPSAFSGIIAAVILAVSRAIGETMIVVIAAGQQPRWTFDPRVPIETMTTYMVQVGLGDVPTGTLEYRTLFVIGATLFVMTFVMNYLTFRLRQRIQRGRL